MSTTIKITFSTENAAFEDNFDGEMALVIRQIANKIPRLQARRPGCVCSWPEGDDTLFDSNGNTIGSIAYKEAK